MSLVQKVGYITIVFWGLWGCQISFSIIYKLYKSYFSLNKALDLSRLGKWAIVTGCSRGIGKAFAEILAKKGLNIVLVNVYSPQYIRQQDSIENIAENIECLYDVQTKIIHLNISEGLEAYSELEKKIVGLEIGILINNFGQNYPHPEYFLDLPHNDKIYMSIIQCNIVVITNMCRVILPQMVLRQKGVIINVASSVAVIPSPLLTVYAATKAYILKFSMNLHLEYSKHGVIIQCLLPASINNSLKSCLTCSSNWISPTPEQYVKNAIVTVGKDDITTGFFPHAIFVWIIQMIHKLSPTFITLTITSIMEINRNYAIRRYALNDKEMDSRCLKNPFEDYSEERKKLVLNSSGTNINDDFRKKLNTATQVLLKRLENFQCAKDDYSIYTGKPGIGYAFYHYGKYFGDEEYVLKSIKYIDSSVKSYPLQNIKDEVTFLIGYAGPLALGAVLFYFQNNEVKSKEMISKLQSLSTFVINTRDMSDELLYGRSGYLYSLLFVNKYVSPAPIDRNLIKQVIDSIINSGKKYAQAKRIKSPLMYEWYDVQYIGGAHGLAGILYLLLQAREYLTDEQLKTEIEPSLQWLEKLQFSSGNFPHCPGGDEELIHWCHGAPGMTMLFCLSYEIFKKEQYLKTALECGEIVWKKGILRKGCGICHGVAGNAYSFLSLFQLTKDPKHLYRACKFAEWCFDYEKNQLKPPDTPFSLFEGMAGTFYFLIDMQKPSDAKFPGYSL